MKTRINYSVVKQAQEASSEFVRFIYDHEAEIVRWVFDVEGIEFQKVSVCGKYVYITYMPMYGNQSTRRIEVDTILETLDKFVGYDAEIL